MKCIPDYSYSDLMPIHMLTKFTLCYSIQFVVNVCTDNSDSCNLLRYKLDCNRCLFVDSNSL
jgi:hypothetical protein